MVTYVGHFLKHISKGWIPRLILSFSPPPPPQIKNYNHEKWKFAIIE